MSEPEEILVFFEKEIEEVLSLASKLKFDSSHVLHQHVVGLYGSIIELSSSIKVLYKSGHFSAIPVILRTILEAFVDLRNLCQDHKYGYSLTMNTSKESLKFLKAAKDDMNVYAEMIASDPDIDNHITKFYEEIKILKDKGIKEIRIKEKFEQASMASEYQTIYHMLCAATHNDIRALRARHLVISDGSFTFEIFKNEDKEAMCDFLGIASELLLRATYEIHGLLNSGKDNELQSLRKELNNIRGDA